MSLVSDFGLIATKQLRNKALLATARDFKLQCLIHVHHILEIMKTHLIVACYELRHRMQSAIAREFFWTRYLLESSIQLRLLPLHLLVCFHCLPHYTGNRPVMNRCISLLTFPLVQLPVLPCMLAARRVTSLQECLLQSLAFSQFRVRSVFS